MKRRGKKDRNEGKEGETKKEEEKDGREGIK